MNKKEPVRVLVAQGRCLLREALIERLGKEEWIDVCATAVNTNDLRVLVDLHRPRVLVINVSLKCSAGITSLKKLKNNYPRLSIVALSCESEYEDAYIGHILRAGADGYISAEDSLEDLVQAIREIDLGRMPYLSDSARKRQRNCMLQDNALLYLSPQEVEVFFLTGCGYAPQWVAEKMKLSVKTIETYRERIRRKMNMVTGAELQHMATSFVRNAARRSEEGGEEQVVREMLSATG